MPEEIFETVGDMQLASHQAEDGLRFRISKQGRKTVLFFSPEKDNFELEELSEAFREMSREAPQFLIFECMQCGKEFQTRNGNQEFCKVCQSRDIKIMYENPTHDIAVGNILISAYFYGARPVLEIGDRTSDKVEIFQMVSQDLDQVAETIQEIDKDQESS